MMSVPDPADPARRATAWLEGTYGGLVELAAPRPVCETDTAWLMACRTLAQPGFPRTPMLASSVVVPKIGGHPFHPAPNDPFADLQPVPPPAAAERITGQSRRINARGCVAAVHTVIDGFPSRPGPWRTGPPAPGWWTRLRRRHFPGFEQLAVDGWHDVVRAVEEPGPDTRGLVWVRRAMGGHEISGHLIYVQNLRGRAVFLDALTASLARLDTHWVRDVVLVRRLPGETGRTVDHT
ncbi:toxin glutamine deamidase domain-containing protein [Streptomyces sp. NPDC058953]|uniref:toxin glutamine deamidase domain-containing protein n=1 Tax=Streptomyces sp. NPDC058953 TaxID=3346676 RepID=UPI0036B3E7DE